jgi:hypothetical protein
MQAFSPFYVLEHPSEKKTEVHLGQSFLKQYIDQKSDEKIRLRRALCWMFLRSCLSVPGEKSGPWAMGVKRANGPG